MDIYSILASKPHNPHYLNRYITFIEHCQQKNVGYEGYVEKHHICPKAKDMFPEYICFKPHPWNCAVLTTRQHFIAHIMLWKAFPSKKSCSEAVWAMSNGNWKQFNNYSKLYESMRMEHSKRTKERIYSLLEAGEHHFQNSEFQRGNALKRIKERTHHFIGETNPSIIRMKEGTHNFIGEKNPFFNSKRFGQENPFYGKTHSKETKQILRNASKGKKHSNESKKKMSMSRQEAKNPRAIHIRIYDENGILRYDCKGNFYKTCKENNLPNGLLRNSAQNNGIKIRSQKNKMFSNWSAKLVSTTEEEDVLQDHKKNC